MFGSTHGHIVPPKSPKEDTTCDCTETVIVSEAGFAEKFPRYLGTWYKVGTYHEMPMYRCVTDCQALSDKMVNSIFYPGHYFSKSRYYIFITA